MDNYRRTYDETYLPAFVRVIEDPPEKTKGQTNLDQAYL